MKIQIIITNQFGEFFGKIVEVNEEQLETLMEMVRNFYSNGGFELSLENSEFVVFPPEVVKNSYLKVLRVS